MPLLAVVSCLLSMGKGRNLHGWHLQGMFAKRFLKPSVDSATVPQGFVMLICKSWRPLLFTYNISIALTGVDEARLDLFARKHRAYDAIPPTRATWARSMWNVLPTKLGSSRDRQLSLSKRSAVQPTRGGLRQERSGRYVGHLFYLLRQAVRSWPSVPARKAAAKDANASAQDCLALALCSCVCAWALNINAGTLLVIMAYLKVKNCMHYDYIKDKCHFYHKSWFIDVGQSQNSASIFLFYYNTHFCFTVVPVGF